MVMPPVECKVGSARMLLVFILCCSGWYARPAFSDGGESKITAADAKTQIQPLLEDDAMVKVDWTPSFVWKMDEYTGIPLPSESLDHSDGIFGIRESRANLYQVRPLYAGFYSSSQLRVLKPRTKVMTQEQCKDIAESFLRKHFSWFFDAVSEVVHTSHPGSTTGLYKFEWQKYGQEKLPSTSLSCIVRAVDGKIVSFSSSEFKEKWQHKVAPSEAIENLLQVARENTGVTNVQVSGWYPDGLADLRFYTIGLKATRKADNATVVSSGEVDAMSGAIRLSREGWSQFSRIEPPLEDRMPVWTNQGLLFISNRKLEGFPEWAEPPSQVLLRKADGELKYVTSDLSVPSRGLSGLPNSSWVVVERAGWTYGLNLEDGVYRILGNPMRKVIMPSIERSGSWAVATGSGQSGGDNLDLFLDDLKRGISLGLRTRIAISGDQYMAITSPDSSKVYFAFAKQEDGKINTSLGCLKREDIIKQDIVKDPKFEVLTKYLPDAVERMSCFPDGKRLLLQMANSIFLVDTNDGKIQPLELKDLVDTEMDNSPVTDVVDGWAGPDNDSITFSGMVRPKGKRPLRRIYSCHLDGSGLKVITSDKTVSTNEFTFTGSAKDAYEVAREWALTEATWSLTMAQR